MSIPDTAATEYRNLPLALLTESTTNPRRIFDEGFRKQYVARCHHKPKALAKVASARRLAVRLYWMLRTNTPYPEIARIEGSPGVGMVSAS